MAKEKKKTNLGDLGRDWLERVKKIRSKAKDEQKSNLEYSPETQVLENDVEVPSDSGLFAGPVYEELSAKQVFTGDEDFYKSLEDARYAGTSQSSDTRPILMVPKRYKRFSFVQKALTGSIVLISAMLLYAILKSPSGSTGQIKPALHKTQASQPPVAETDQVTPLKIQKPGPTLDSTQPLSLKVAQTFYLNEDYDQALLIYEKLHKSLPVSPREDLMRDFLQLQIALCMERTADYEQAARLLRKVLKSNSPAVRVVAHYHCSLLEMQKKQYLNARIKAYQAIALIDAIGLERDWALSLKRDCYFLTAEAVSRKVLFLCDADKNLPEYLWGNLRAANEPFIGLNETQLRTFLKSGSEQLNLAVLGPQIQQLNNKGGLTRYDVTCNGAPVEELLARFAANAAVDLHWNLAADELGTRKRLVYLYLPAVTTQQFATTAAGCVGLLSRTGEKGVLIISNPARYTNVSEYISILSKEAVSLWQKFLLRFPADKRLANVHFALGLLHTQKDRAAEAMAEYKLVANRFARSSLAPFALLNSSRLKISMRNYPAGRLDLKQLVEQFPDTEIAGTAYLYLADTTAKAGLNTEAARLYSKVYNLSLSSESQRAAALGAGKCFYYMEDSESAEKWLTRYIGLIKNRKNKDLHSAYFLLGKTNLDLGKIETACGAFRYALTGQLSRDEYVETISALIGGYIKQQNYVQALDVLEGAYSSQFSQKESIEILLLKSKTLRAMGLVDKAIAILGDRAEYIPDPQLKAKLFFELSNCYIDKGSLNLAHKKLTEILVLTESGPLGHETALKLAEICLRLGQVSQAISVCSQLLDLPPSEQIKQKTLVLMAKAYNRQKNYDRAALALLGRWK
ncbi:MAG: tetratricopeptide repeat protein [Planctomycetes bacterium]|nr:tetratricopeptide repeat protein [Planctomycetota bacterium]